MKKKNRITRFLRVLVHIWWYFTLGMAALLPIVFLGSQFGAWDGVNSYNFGITWEMEDVAPVEQLNISVSDSAGNEYPVEKLEGEGSLSFVFPEEGMGELAIPFYLILFPALGIGIWGIFQLKKLFDNLAKGRYFEEINAIRIRRLAFAIFGFAALHLLIQIVFESMFTVQTGSNIDVSGVEIGLNPVILSGLLLLALSEVFREGAIMKSEQDLTI